MADEEQQVPDVQVYWKDRRDLYLALASAAIGPTLSFILALKRLPQGAYEWVVMGLTAAGAMVMVAKSRSLATPQSAGAMRAWGETQKRLSDADVRKIVEAAEAPRPLESRTGQLPSVTP